MAGLTGAIAATLPDLGTTGAGVSGCRVPHQPQIMLCVLVVILDFDRVAGQCGGARERKVSLVVAL